MKISTLELIRMMWRWEEWRHLDTYFISNGKTVMITEFGMTAWNPGEGETFTSGERIWACNLLTYFITRPFFYRLVRKLNQRKP